MLGSSDSNLDYSPPIKCVDMKQEVKLRKGGRQGFHTQKNSVRRNRLCPRLFIFFLSFYFTHPHYAILKDQNADIKYLLVPR